MPTFLVPTGHLGFTPFESPSFEIGLGRCPDYLVADSGSCDIGPYPLGSDRSHSPSAWQRHDLERMLLGARDLGVPMIVGSAGDTGTDSQVAAFAGMIRSIAAEHGLGPFTMATIRAELTPARLTAMLEHGRPIVGLGGLPDATPELLARTNRAVAVMGAEPIMEALRQGADVVIAGRACDSALCAAPALLAGIPAALAWYLGKVLECASFCAEPFAGKESVLGSVSRERVVVEAMHPEQRCTPLSLAGHAMYERVDPFFEHVPGGTLDMRELVYRQLDEKATEVTGMRWLPNSYAIKVEGAGWVGDRAVAVMGIRDPITLSFLDEAIEWARGKVTERLGAPGERHCYQLFFHVFGRNGVMGYLEPSAVTGHEVAVVVEVLAESAGLANEICALGSRSLFYARLPVVKGTAGNASFWSDEVLAARPGYIWTLNHLVPVEDPLELFAIELEEVRAVAEMAG
ncbi:MAG TPA: acyclic terpene utilization AtuA family protein [Candidatus Dormibacteraeota bacterium]|nr:acyclic terpene utilization AtuA family protein [Candidatus Dormibacteraeota bacterium]